MININTQLEILIDNNSTFTNYSQEMVNYVKDSITLTLATATDYLYIGYNKPINAVYCDITTPNGSKGTSTLEYWNGTSWTALEGVSDDTQGMFRSGFVRWDREQTNQVTNSVNSVEKYWYRLKPSEDRTSIVLSGVNLVFSDDYELSLENPLINDAEFLGDANSHILYHVAVRKEILAKLAQKNYIKYNSITGDKEDINVWDMLEINELTMAATYLTLAKIYYALSDADDDVWASKNKQYKGKFDKHIQLASLSLDVDDDGLVSDSENKPPFKTKFMNR